MFQLYADKNKLTIRNRELLTSGSVNVNPVRIEFSPDWDGLERVAVFKAGKETRSVLLDASGECMIPWETLAVPGIELQAGVYGTRGGEVVLPTVWASLGRVLEGAAPGEDARPPTPELWEQELERKQDKLTGLPGQVVGFSESGDVVPVDMPPGGGSGGSSIPPGGIIIWSGAADAVPDGWAVCDGENGTPDLRGRFVLAANDAHKVGETGGSEEVTLTTAQMPAHTHDLRLFSSGGSTSSGTYQPSGKISQAQASGVAGSSKPHPNMPPYYVLCYIMKL